MNALRHSATAILLASAAALAVTVGSAAPAFSLNTYGGGTYSLAQQQGKVVVLFFFGCT